MINAEEIFAKSIVHLNASDINKIIDVLTIDTLNEFRDNKTPASAIVSVDDKMNFVLMFFYTRGTKKIGFQYVVNFTLNETDSNILGALFAKYVLRAQRLSGVKNTHSIKNLSEFYGLQIKGYKEYLKKPKQ